MWFYWIVTIVIVSTSRTIWIKFDLKKIAFIIEKYTNLTIGACFVVAVVVVLSCFPAHLWPVPAVSLPLPPGSAASPPLHRQRQTDQIVFTLRSRCTYFVQYIFYFTSVCVHKLIFLVLYFLKINLKMRETTAAASASLFTSELTRSFFFCGFSSFWPLSQKNDLLVCSSSPPVQFSWHIKHWGWWCRRVGLLCLAAQGYSAAAVAGHLLFCHKSLFQLWFV